MTQMLIYYKKVNRALLAEQALEDAIKFRRKTARRDNDNALQGQITTLNPGITRQNQLKEKHKIYY